MASRSMLNVTVTIAVAQGIAMMILDRYGLCIGLREYIHLDDVDTAATEAYRLWPGDISGKGLTRLKKMVNLFEDQVLKTEQSLTTILSTGIALLETLAAKLTDGVRHRAIRRLILAMTSCYVDYDPDYDFEDGYLTAAMLESRWVAIIDVA